jgi:RNA polymerase sigma-70 factor (ECF subfamily)
MDQVAALEAALPTERPRLVHLCAHLTGAPEVAEDLAQETLVEAWRNLHKLADPRGCPLWLSAIARNVCLRWRAARRPATLPLGTTTLGDEATPLDQGPWLVAADDIELELERGELVELLDRALGLLPQKTRALLVERFVRESSHAEIAARLGVSEGAVRVQVHRGKLALRRVLTTQMREETVAYGFLSPGDEGWQETHIWSPCCGRHRLHARRGQKDGALIFECRACGSGWYPDQPAETVFPDIVSLKSHKAILSRYHAWVEQQYQKAMSQRMVLCHRCGSMMPVEFGFPDQSDVAGIRLRCETCNATRGIDLVGIALILHQTQQFWRRHPRMALMPLGREVEYNGRTALVISYASLSEPAKIDVVVARDTCEVLLVHETSA